MAHERVTGEPLPINNLYFDADVYDLGWDGRRNSLEPDDTVLPSAEYAVYLINAVKFHCGQMFHLFDEESFMHGFSEFYQNQNDPSHRRNLWYVHFLLILAFGKAFVVGQTHSRRPAGVEYFVRAMKLLPDITFLHTQPVNSVEILCCVALYLQCLDFRGSAYTKVSRGCFSSVDIPITKF